jgi:hypothetical protein
MTKNDDIRAERSGYIAGLAHVSFVCFIAGLLVGFINYQDLRKEEISNMSTTIQSGEAGQKNHVTKMPAPPPTPKQ